MFERYVEGARRAIFFARNEARDMHSPYIEPEHLLLGIALEPSILDQWFGVASHLSELRGQVKPPLEPWSGSASDLPLSNSNKRVLAFAAEEAERANHYWIGKEHLLLGILREESPDSVRMLKSLGVALEDVRARVKEIKQDRPAPVTQPEYRLITNVQQKWLIFAAVSGWLVALFLLSLLFARP